MTRNMVFKFFTCVIFVTTLIQFAGLIYRHNSNNQQTGLSVFSEIGSFIIVCIYLIAPIVMILFTRSEKEVGRVLFLSALLSSIFLPYIAIVQHLVNDPLVANFLGLVISLPLSIGLAFLTFIELIKSD